MHFHQADLRTRVGNPGLLVGLGGSDAGRVEVAAVPAVALHFPTVGAGDLQCFHGDDVPLAQGPGNFRARDDGAGGAVGHSAAIKQAQRLGDHRRVQHRRHVHGFLQVGLRILRAVRVTLDRHVGHGALEVFLAHAVRGAISRRQLREVAGRRTGDADHVVRGAPRAHGQAAVPGVLEFLHSKCERDVGRAGRDRVHSTAKRLRAARAVVLHFRDADVVQAQCHRQRNTRRPDVHRIERDGQPRRVQLRRADAGVGHRFLIGLHHQAVGVHVPALTELGAAHAKYRHLVFDALGHGRRLLKSMCWKDPYRT